MVAKTPKVKAACGQWSYKRKGEDIVEFTGTFSLQNASAAYATSHFLHRSQITDTDTQPRPLEKFSDGFVVRLRSDWGDNMFKFENWALHHGLLPKLERELQQRQHTYLDGELARREASKFAFRPAPEEFMQPLIGRMHWELHEAGYPDSKNPRGHETMVAVTDDAALAFQTAYYLNKRGYIDNRQLENINADIKHQLTTRQKDSEYRIAVRGQYIQQFEAEFPQVTQNVGGLDKRTLDELHAHSQLPSVLPPR